MDNTQTSLLVESKHSNWLTIGSSTSKFSTVNKSHRLLAREAHHNGVSRRTPICFKLNFLGRFGESDKCGKRLKHFLPDEFGSYQTPFERPKLKEIQSPNLTFLNTVCEQMEEKESDVDEVPRWCVGGDFNVVEGWEGYKILYKLKAIKRKLQRWSKEIFGDVEKQIKDAEASIEDLDRREGLEGLDVAAKRRKSYFSLWKIWLIRKKSSGDREVKWNGLKKGTSLFSSNEEACWGLEGINWASISESEAAWVERPFEESEVQRAVFDCGRVKSPGPDGYSLQMFQHFWEFLKVDIVKVMEEFFETGIINAVTNETFICLIPKKSDSLKVTDYRPISLVTGLYKIVAKTLVSRLREVMGSTISPHQGGFVKGRQILDAVLIANELVEEVRQKKEEGLMFKIDFEKAYDHVEWRFLDEILQRKGFGNRWRKWVQGCQNSANFSILINGRPKGKFHASRRLRQGDPLSPFLFTLVVDVLSRLMEKAHENHLIKGLGIGQERVEISHLQFADDTIFFLAEDEDVWNNLLEVLNLFCTISGLKINKAKCSMAGINSDCEKLKGMADSWGCEVGSWPIKYLGLPLGGRPKALMFWDPVVEKMEKRLQSWKKAFLSKGGRLTLIQFVLGSLPIYYMSLFKIPCGVIGRLEKLMKGFLWEGVEEGKKNHLVKWEIVIKSKEEGGLCVGNLRNQKEALLAKWLWRFPKEPNSLWHKVIRSKYGLQDNGWNANPPLRGSSRSPWKDISCGLQSFLQCCKFEVGNGERVRFWEDGWLEGGPLKEQYPRLFLLSRMHNQNISSFVDLSINSLSWNFDFRRNLNQVETEEAARLLQKVENVRLSQSRADDRRWKLELSGLFACKSYRSSLSNNGIVQHFPPSSQIWKSKVPPKVKVLVWLVAIGKLNTCDQIQRRSPFEVRVSWVIPKGCFKLLSTNFEALGIGRKAKALLGCLVSAVFWNIWLECNKRIFEDYTGVGVVNLWGRVRYWAALWVSVSNDFKNYSLTYCGIY
ncbi:uncharacterized protein LOC103928158 [Pyrus x bretschneideri]|uniref:uncharacterized protein LOC103928158 n=1 Tax=Pyrus x bretschneideri TaxID=225117 RepID=UPI0005119FB1|nr:uncharacterized protein LOC103928158 [Pyrus x bretschneideri]